MSAVVTDTHALIWYVNKSSKLSSTARLAFNQAEAAADLIYVPSIVIVELRYLVEKRTLTEADYRMMLAKINNPMTALAIAPLDLATADALSQIPRADVPDMLDRIIAATAYTLGLPLVTRDGKIRASGVTTIW